MKTLLTFLVIFTLNSFAQTFESNQLINQPGKILEYDIYAYDTYPGSFNCISWINKENSNYSIYLRELNGPENENLLISTDIGIMSNPEICAISNGVKIAWQEFADGYFKVVAIDYKDGTFGEKEIILDSLITNPQISLSNNWLAWVDRGTLRIMSLNDYSKVVTLESADCSQPDLYWEDNDEHFNILYIQPGCAELQLILCQYNNGNLSYLGISKGYNENPNFGIHGGIAFENLYGEKWRLNYTSDIFGKLDSTFSETCNYKNPTVFSYAITTKTFESNETPFFVAFDNDSLEGNSEVLIKTFYYDMIDSMINISNMEGNDFKPKIGYKVSNDTVYVIITWLHDANGLTSLWVAKTIFDPIWSSVTEESRINTFALLQNYPNPFNPSTTIEYRISETSLVNLKILDITGREVAVLENEVKSPGNYKVKYEASGLSSGIYFMQLKAGEFQSTKKICLLK